MPSTFRNQKNLNEWLELDYYQRPRGLRRWRNRLTILLLVGCTAGVLGAIFLFPRAPTLVQAGPVTSAHSMFNHECQRCHDRPFETAKKLLPGNSSVRAVSDAACTQCHEGPPHNLLVSEETRCATCHREHRGRVQLARVPDGDCTVCHGDLKNHRKGGDEGLRFENIHAFNDDHPEFRLIRDRDKDAAKLRFNHRYHLVELEKLELRGLETLPARRAQRFTEAMKRLKERSCNACHETDAAGRYMKPINYDRHCADCHPLSIQLTGEFKGKNDEETRQLTEAVNGFNQSDKSLAPHKEPSVIRATLRERLLAFVQTNRVISGESEVGGGLVDRGVLGKRPGVEQWKWVNRKLEPLERLLFSSEQLDGAEHELFQHNCTHCHIKKLEDGGAKVAKDDDGLPGLPVFEKTNIPPRWLTHARFSHQHHRMLDCTECHDAKNSKETKDILLPSVGSCQKCHNPSVGVRNDCVECHGYHDRGIAHEVHKDWTIDRSLGK